MDEKQLIKISRRLGILRSLARISTGSKTNDKIIFATIRDVEALLQYVYGHIQPNLFGTTQTLLELEYEKQLKNKKDVSN